MAYSGTVGTTVISVQDVIDDVIQDQVDQENLSYDEIMKMINRLEMVQDKIESNEKLSNMDLEDVVDAMINLQPLQIEQITVGEIYEQFNSGRRGLYRSTPN